LTWGGVIASTFAMPNGVFEVYQQIARVLSAFFILLQVCQFAHRSYFQVLLFYYEPDEAFTYDTFP